MSRLKIGYVGCGFMAQKVHLPNLMAIPNCELVALAEIRPKLGALVRDHYRIPTLYPDHRALAADPKVEAVAVSAAFHVQGEIAKDLLRAGKHVFMEKPMAISVAQAQAILAAAKAGGARLMVGYMKRYDAGNELAKAHVERYRASGELGRITFVRNHGFCGDWVNGLDVPMLTTGEAIPTAAPSPPDWLPPQRFDQYVGYLQQYTHNLNLVRWLLDAGEQVAVRHVDLDSDGYTGVTLLDVAGVRVAMETGRVSHYRWDEHTQIYFEDGWVKAWAPPLLLRNAPAEVEVYRAGEEQTFTRPLPRERWTWSYRREMEHFIDAVQHDRPFRSSGEDTLTDVRLMEDIFQAYVE